MPEKDRTGQDKDRKTDSYTEMTGTERGNGQEKKKRE